MYTCTVSIYSTIEDYMNTCIACQCIKYNTQQFRSHLTREGQCNVRQEIRVSLKHVRGMALDILLLEERAHVRTGGMGTRLQQVTVTLNRYLIHKKYRIKSHYNNTHVHAYVLNNQSF